MSICGAAGAGAPFESPALVAGYESWYATPFGRLADELERGLLLEMLAPLAPGATLLEIGCGTAHFAGTLAARGFRVAGIDPSAALLSVARQRVPVARARAERLPFGDGSFDGAFLIGVLDFVDDPLSVLIEARRVARERVAVLALAGDSYLALRRRIRGRLGHPLFSRARFYSRRSLLELARASGTEPERVRGALVLPPWLAGRVPALERHWARGTPPFAGILAFSLRGAR